MCNECHKEILLWFYIFGGEGIKDDYIKDNKTRMCMIMQMKELCGLKKFFYDNVRLDANNNNLYYNVGHILFQYQYLVQKTIVWKVKICI